MLTERSSIFFRIFGLFGRRRCGASPARTGKRLGHESAHVPPGARQASAEPVNLMLCPALECLRLRVESPAKQQSGTMTNEICTHLSAITVVKHPADLECEECVKIGSSWVHLRTCQQCGVTLCCDSSPNQHASKHARDTSHPVIASAQPGERWLYCYPDEAFVGY